MTGKKTAVIIGAGIGGIVTAIYLARNGYVVTVYEKKLGTRRTVRTADTRWTSLRPWCDNAHDAGHLQGNI